MFRGWFINDFDIMKKHIYIELLGLPGSGKSAISKELIEELKESQCKIITLEDISEQFFRRNIFQRYIYVIVNILSNKKDFLIFFRLFVLFLKLRPSFGIEMRSYIGITKLLFLKSTILDKKEASIFIFEGEMHLLSLINLSTRRKSDIKDLLNALLIGEVVRIFISVKTPVNIAIERAYDDYISTEKRPSLFKINKNERIKRYNEVSQNCKKIVDLLRKENERFSIIEINGTYLPKKNINYIIQILKKDFYFKSFCSNL